MEKILIEGGRSLNGTVRISGAKNAALPIITACILSGGTHCLDNIPNLRDIVTLKKIMAKLGVLFHDDKDQLQVNADHLTCYEAPYELVKTMRASILLLGPLLARHGRAKISLPGGCAIGARPVNLHLKALTAMGVDMHLDRGYIHAKTNRMQGANILFDTVTVTGTENIMMAATTAAGTTVLKNAAKEPEVLDLADMLRKMGADIEGDGTDTIVIRGQQVLQPARHSVIPDRIETGTFMIASAMTRGDIHIENCRPDHLTALVERLEASGTNIQTGENRIHVKGPDVIESSDIRTSPYPGFPTDLQAQFMAMMCIANGWSMVRETVFENRFIHVSELQRMGADIEINGHQALVRGTKRLLSAPVMATDLRASASLILAALVAEGGPTEVHRIYHLDRGYDALDKKLRALGVSVWRENA
jgi:UDP-N-acetylglucosamine 1-carboxyvinyltransferase